MSTETQDKPAKKSVNPNEISLTIDGQQISVLKGTTLYEAAQKLGIDIPIFCYQDRMPPFGACRMCLVEVEKMPKLAASCSQGAMEGMVVHTKSEKAEAGRRGILEFLLINHPLDCPICDKGGECPLQENTLDYGPGFSRFVEEKRRNEKHVPLGPVLIVDQERCIACARCTRFGEIIAGDDALKLKERGFRTEIGTPNNQPVESKFIGNTIMICPVGALTSQVYRFRARPWDNDSTESTCTLCAVGCSLQIDTRDNEILRTRSIENRDVNDIWLCDKGWFGYEHVYDDNRIKTPLIRRNGELVSAGWEEVLELLAEKLNSVIGNETVGAIGGSPLTVEENYLFQKLFRETLNSPNVDYRIDSFIQDQNQEAIPAGTEISLGEAEQLSDAIVLGADLTEEFPVLWLRLKQGINHGAKVIYAGHYQTEIAPHIAQEILHTPGQEIEALSQIEKEFLPQIKEKTAIFVGEQYLKTTARREILAILLKWRQQYPGLTLNLLEGTGNDLGARFAGMHPSLGPAGTEVKKQGLSTFEMLEKATQTKWDFLYVTGANPAAKIPAKTWTQARENIQFLVVQDLFLTKTAEEADIVLPALSFIEKGGHVINIEGRIQEIRAGKEAPEGLLSDAEIFTLLAQRLGKMLSVDPDFSQHLKAKRLPYKLPEQLEAEPTKQPAQTAKKEELFLSLSKKLFDHGTRVQYSNAIEQLVKEPKIRLHIDEAAKRNLKNGEQVIVSSDQGSVQGALEVTDRVAKQTIVIPQGFQELSVYELGLNLSNGKVVTIKKCS